MLALSLFALLAQSWPPEPLPAPFALGQKLAVRRHALADVGKAYRQPVGIVFDGIAHRESQYAWLLTAECASEWLGYSVGRELRREAETKRLWADWGAGHKDEAVLVLLLTAYPKRAILTKEEESRSDRWGMEELRASLILDKVECPPKGQEVFERLSGKTDSLAKEYPFGEAAGLFFAKPTRAGLHPYYVPIGPYYGVVWTLRFDTTKAPPDWKEAKFSFLSRGVRTDAVFARGGLPARR